MKLEKFKEWVKAKKAIIISVCVGVVICAGAIIGSKIIINNHNKLVAEETTTESTTVNMDAYKITTEPETETTVIDKGDSIITKDKDGNETINRKEYTTAPNVNGGGGQIKTSNGTYNGEQSTTKATSSTPKNGEKKVENGKTYIYDAPFNTWYEAYGTEGKSGCIDDGINPEDYTEDPDAHFTM